MTKKKNTNLLENKNILLGITGSIAAYKSADLASKLVKLGANVNVLMTSSALNFIGSETFKGITHNNVFYDLWSKENDYIEHINLGLKADCMVIAPCTSNTISKLALGISDDPVSTTALSIRKKLLVAPAMDGEMFEKFSTQNNIKILKKFGVKFVGPDNGNLASGIVGIGRMSENSEIIGNIRKILGENGDYKNKKIVVSAGGTIEPIDPIRHITNKSSGLMGFSLAEAARDRGANVTLVTSSKRYNKSSGIKVIKTSTGDDFKKHLKKACEKSDLLIMTAAISDFIPTNIFHDKIKKNEEKISLEFKPVKNWLDEIGDENLIKIIFSAETTDLVSNAKNKLNKKNIPFVVANDVTKEGSGFSTETNIVTFIWKNGKIEHLPKIPKINVAHEILDRTLSLID